jgi:hypothetical protein
LAGRGLTQSSLLDSGWLFPEPGHCWQVDGLNRYTLGLTLSVTWYSLASILTSLATGLYSFMTFRFLL